MDYDKHFLPMDINQRLWVNVSSQVLQINEVDLDLGYVNLFLRSSLSWVDDKFVYIERKETEEFSKSGFRDIMKVKTKYILPYS